MPSENHLKPFRASERQRSAEMSCLPGAGRPRETDPPAFPFLEELITSEEFSTLMRQCEATCRKLEELTRKGTPDQRSRARLAMGAYGRALELLNQLIEFKDGLSTAGKTD